VEIFERNGKRLVGLAEPGKQLLSAHDVSEAVALADRVVLIEDGRLTLDEAIDLPRPRSRGNAEFARREDTILRRVLAG
jgi:sulfonate transport system ATP-binding protein